MTWPAWLLAGFFVGGALAYRADRRRIEALIAEVDAWIDQAKVREIRRLLSERAWYGGVMHGVSLEVHPTASGSWWLTWGPDRDGLVPDDQLDGELLRWLRGER